MSGGVSVSQLAGAQTFLPGILTSYTAPQELTIRCSFPRHPNSFDRIFLPLSDPKHG